MNFLRIFSLNSPISTTSLISKYLYFLIFFALTSCSICKRNTDREQIQKIVSSLPTYEKEALSSFFRLLLESESSGYSLYGEKPLSVQEFIKDELPLSLNENLIKRSCLLREGMRIWEKSGLASFQNNYVVHASRLPNSDGWLDVFLINKQALLHVVDQNLTLFQYVLGPKVTALSLLHQFLDPQQNFFSILSEDRVLSGIVLGYGMQNALHGSRLEYLMEQETKNDPTLARIKSSLPSFGFSSALKERNLLEQELFITVNKTDEQPRLPWFSAIHHEETDKLFKSYKATQKKLKTILASPYFLQEVLSQFFGCRIQVPPPQNTFNGLLLENLRNENNIAALLGQDLYSSLQKEDATPEEIENFIKGILDNAGEREDLNSLLQTYNKNSPDNKKLLYRLGQKVRDQYKALGEIAPIEEIAAYIQKLKTGNAKQPNRREIIDQSNLLAAKQ